MRRAGSGTPARSADDRAAAELPGFGEYTVGDVKRFLAAKGIPVRPV